MKDVRFIWGLPQEDSFMKLKKLVTSAPILVLPDNDLPFWLEANGSGIATGAVLSQQSHEDNAWHPITFLSKALNPVEQNYEIHDTKMLAIIRGLKEWRHYYLEGAHYSIEIWTGHKNLKYFQVDQKLNWCQVRWLLYLSRFDFMLHHKPGWSMGKPDVLSRQCKGNYQKPWPHLITVKPKASQSTDSICCGSQYIYIWYGFVFTW
jgi:hypothetical protein